MIIEESSRGSERRTRRSERTEEALNYQLLTCTERAGLMAMLIADSDGLIVASSPWYGEISEKSEELAAVLPLLARGNDFAGIWLDDQASGSQVLVSGFNAAGTDLFICAVGEYNREVHKEIARAKIGARRILN